MTWNVVLLDSRFVSWQFSAVQSWRHSNLVVALTFEEPAVEIKGPFVIVIELNGVQCRE